jgi:hypothetical protein
LAAYLGSVDGTIAALEENKQEWSLYFLAAKLSVKA